LHDGVVASDSSIVHIPISGGNENEETLRVCGERSVVKHVLFTIGACRPEDRDTGLAEQELMS
jgi:hypothetical protein